MLQRIFVRFQRETARRLKQRSQVLWTTLGRSERLKSKTPRTGRFGLGYTEFDTELKMIDCAFSSCVLDTAERCIGNYIRRRRKHRIVNAKRFKVEVEIV